MTEHIECLKIEYCGKPLEVSVSFNWIPEEPQTSVKPSVEGHIEDLVVSYQQRDLTKQTESQVMDILEGMRK